MTIEEINQTYRTAIKNKEPQCTHDGSCCPMGVCNIGCKYMENDEDGFLQLIKMVTGLVENYLHYNFIFMVIL